MAKWKCDACAEASGGSGFPCILTSDFLPEAVELCCPVSGEIAEFELEDLSKPVNQSDCGIVN